MHAVFLPTEYALDADRVSPSGPPCSQGARLAFHVADEPTTAPATVDTTTAADATITSSGSNSMQQSGFGFLCLILLAGTHFSKF